jgi:hypothetical protein
MRFKTTASCKSPRGGGPANTCRDITSASTLTTIGGAIGVSKKRLSGAFLFLAKSRSRTSLPAVVSCRDFASTRRVNVDAEMLWGRWAKSVKRFDILPFALYSCAAAVMLAACGGPQTPADPPLQSMHGPPPAATHSRSLAANVVNTVSAGARCRQARRQLRPRIGRSQRFADFTREAQRGTTDADALRRCISACERVWMTVRR